MFSSFHFQTIYQPIRVLYGTFYIYIFLVQIFCAAKVVHITNLLSAMSKLSITSFITKSCLQRVMFSDSQGNSIVFIRINTWITDPSENHQNYMNFTGFQAKIQQTKMLVTCTDRNNLDKSYQLVKNILDFPLQEKRIAYFK